MNDPEAGESDSEETGNVKINPGRGRERELKGKRCKKEDEKE